MDLFAILIRFFGLTTISLETLTGYTLVFNPKSLQPAVRPADVPVDPAATKIISGSGIIPSSI
jgi:hypothetical protein